jgi:hypothetical protein
VRDSKRFSDFAVVGTQHKSFIGHASPSDRSSLLAIIIGLMIGL